MIAVTDVCTLISCAGAIATLYFLYRDRGRVPTRGILPKLAMAAFALAIALFIIDQHFGTSTSLAFHIASALAWGLTGANFYFNRGLRPAI